MNERQSFEEKKRELEQRIQELKYLINQKEAFIANQEKIVYFNQMSEQPSHPSYISLKNAEKAMKKRLEELNYELSQRKPMQDLLIKQKQLEAKSKGNLVYSGNPPEIWSDLDRWEKMPGIVQTKVDEQENEIKLKQVKIL